MACISHIRVLKVRNGFLNKQGREQNPVKKRYIIGLPTQLFLQNFGVVSHPFRYKGTSVIWSKILQMGIFPAENLIAIIIFSRFFMVSFWFVKEGDTKWPNFSNSSLRKYA
jgi:hypothetical protein